MMMVVFVVLAVVAGISNPIQSGSNSALLKATGAPIASALLIYLIGALCVLLCAPFLGLQLRGALSKVGSIPWWALLGGVCNAIFLMASILVTKKLGSAVFTTLVVVTAIITSVFLDQFGLLGFDVRAATPLRIVGCVLAAVGFIFIARF